MSGRGGGAFRSLLEVLLSGDLCFGGTFPEDGWMDVAPSVVWSETRPVSVRPRPLWAVHQSPGSCAEEAQVLAASLLQDLQFPGWLVCQAVNRDEVQVKDAPALL